MQYGLQLFLVVGSRNAAPGRAPPLLLRAGLHLGEIWQDETRIYGNGVNIAARIKAEAEPGSLLVSEDVYRQISNKLDLPARELPPRILKNIERPLPLFELLSLAPSTEAAIAARAAAEVSAGPRPREPAAPRQAERPAAAAAPGPARDARRRAATGAATPLTARSRALSLRARREAAEKELLGGLRKFLGAGALGAGLAYAYTRNESFWLALAALVFGLLPSLSGLKKFLRACLDLGEAKREERRASSE